VASAFISYAREDQEFVLALAAELRGKGLDVRFDQVVLHVGDSLMETISREITEGDFLIAVVSPDSTASPWCRIELEIAMTQGIDERRVKVLPVRYREGEMPPFLVGKFWSDADTFGVQGVAAQLAEAIAKQLAGWQQIREGAGPNRVLDDAQRRLRYAVDNLPERVRVGLPLESLLASADWGGYFRAEDPRAAELDLREELRSVRTQVAQGLPITKRWRIDKSFGEISASGRDARAFLWGIARDGETRRITIFISGTADTIANERLPREVAEAKETNGRSVVVALLPLNEPPAAAMATTAGIRWPVES
jgi:hypothetical protein